MKKLLTGLTILAVVLGSQFAQAANKEQARATTDQLNTFLTPSQDVAPNKAIMYKSNRDNVDDTVVTTALSINITATKVIITRGESLALTRCSADFGTAAVVGATIEITTTKTPIRVLCSTADGGLRAFYTTYKQ